MPSIMPGPSSTLMGAPVVTTSAPGPRPEVSSYTWMEGGVPLHRQNLADQRWGPTRTRRTYWRPPGPWPPPAVRIPSQSYRSNSLNLLSHQFSPEGPPARTAGAKTIVPGKTRGFSSSPTVRRKKNIHHVRRSVYAVNNPRLSHLGRRPPVRAQAAGSGAEIPLGADRRGNSAQAGSPAGTSQGKQPKRRQRRKKRGCFEEGPRSAGAATLPTGLTDGVHTRRDCGPNRVENRNCHSGVSLFSSEDIRSHRSLNGLLDVVHYRCRGSPPGRGSG